MRRAVFSLAVTALLASPARAQDEASFRAAADKLGRTLALVAADGGAKRAAALAGEAMPPLLRAPLAQVAESPRAGDLRGLDPSLKGELLGALIAETPTLERALQVYAADAGKRIDREVGRIDQRSRALNEAVKKLDWKASRDRIATIKAARTEPEGATLLLYAGQAALLDALLAEAETPVAQYAVLARLFDRRVDALVRGALRLLDRIPQSAPADLAAVGGAKTVRRARERVAKRLEATVARLRALIRVAVQAARRIREGQLKRIAQGARGKEYEEIVPVVKAYKRQFKQVPALKATPYENVYAEATRAQLHFWLPGEKRWIRAHRRVDPLEPVVKRFLAARDPELRRLATRPRALARLYGLFEAYAQQPFGAGYRTYAEQVREIADKLARLEARATQRGVTAEAFAAALAERVGVSMALFRGGADAAESRMSDQLLRAAVDRGLEAGWLLTQDVERVSRRVRDLRLTGFGLRVDRAEMTRDLWWEPAPASPTWLTPPPERLETGERRCWVWFLTRPGDPAPAPRVAVYARADGRDLVGTAALKAGAVAGAALRAGDPALVARRVGRGFRVHLLPRARPPLRLVASGPGGRKRALAPAPRGGWLTPTALDPAGAWTIRAASPDGRTRAELTLKAAAVRGVVVGAADRPTWWVKPKGRVSARVLEGGTPTRGPQKFSVKDAWGRTVHEASGERLSWTAAVEPGRYRVGAIGAQDAPLAVTRVDPRVVTVRSPLGRPVTELHAGEAAFLRLDVWPVVLAEEIRSVAWRIRGPAGQLSRRTTYPLPGLPGDAQVLPIRLKSGSRSGKRTIEARIVTARGALTVTGSFRVESGGRRLALTFRGPEGPAKRIQLGGVGGRVRTRGELRRAEWTLVGPTGLLRPLRPRYDGQVPLRLDRSDPPGAYWVYLSGVTNAGRRVYGELRLAGDRAQELVLKAPPAPKIGSTITLEVPPPAGFEAPYQVRLGKGTWVPGARLEVTVNANNVLDVTLRDRSGRRARATLRFRGELGRVAVGGPRFGIAANTTTKRIFAADYALLQSYKKKDSLPKDWVVLEWGPMTVEGVRDRIFLTVPYDGPGTGRNVAYRSERFWSGLQTTARERFLDLGVAPNTPYEVLNTPAPRKEQTLFDLVGRLLAEKGGWSFRLESVRVRADGSTPRGGASIVRLVRNGINKRGGGVRRIEVPGPLADMALAVALPKTLDLSSSHRLSFSLSARRNKLLEGRYPDDWEQIAAKALICPELTVKVELGGQTLKATGRRAAQDLTGVELGLAFDHRETELRKELGGSPRGVERHRVTLAVLGRKGRRSEVRFKPLQPGLLANEPETMTITVVGRQRRAVPAAKWPKGRPAPTAVKIDGLEHRFETEDVPESSVELKIVYVRRAPGARQPPPKVPAWLPPLRSGGGLKPIAFDDRRRGAAKALAQDRLDRAERDARAAILAKPSDPRGWALLAQVAHKRQRPQAALARARWSRDLRPTPRAWLVTAEVLLGEGDLDGAAKALKAGLKLKPSGRLAARYRELEKVLD